MTGTKKKTYMAFSLEVRFPTGKEKFQVLLAENIVSSISCVEKLINFPHAL